MSTNPLKQYRAERKLTLVDAAKLFGISNTYLCELEKGRPVPLKTARKIAKGTGGALRVTDLITLEDEETTAA
jgi:DNA-binding XRE family transcriptional regulator